MMEPFPKRQRLYAPLDRAFPQSFDAEHAYYDELGDDILEDEEDCDEEEEEEESTQEAGYDADAELQQKRARLDYKLKSTFESIFEKYERDFDGVGDEIDLETGEIIVNNGHIMEMMDERDAGDTSRARQALRDLTEEPDELPSSSFDETEVMDDEEHDEDDEDEVMSDEDIVEDNMMEDDLILRGFAKANRFQQGSPELGISNAPIVPQKVRKPKAIPRPVQAKHLPSRADILAQFGPQLGPRIVDYVSKQQVPEESHVEPSWRALELPRIVSATRNIESAWRAPTLSFVAAQKRVEPAWQVPELPSTAPVRRPTKNPVIIPPEEERSPSPEASTSIWAPVRPRGRRRLDGADNNALFRGESRAPNQSHRPLHLNPPNYRPAHDSNRQARLSSPKRKRNNFTIEEDNIILNWVSKLRRQGLPLSEARWRELEAEYPQHSATSWKQRYTRKYTYLSTNQVEETDLSNSDVSTENMGYQPPNLHRAGPDYNSGPAATRERPSRIRKPAQTDPRILSWSEAVDTIETLDPILHAGILDDVERANGNERRPESSYNRQDQLRAQEQLAISVSEQSQENMTPPGENRRPYDDFPGRSSLAVEPTPEQEDFLIPGAPCPHADCRLYPTILYKLQRREHEELSQMCLHLFRVHHTTPFPCGEIGCSRKGEDGYFMQLDLVKHVRLTHKSISALHRLRGRVDPAFIEQQVALAKPSHFTSDPAESPVSQPRDSDFMYPQKGLVRIPSSSPPLSIGFDPDRTLTPRGVAGTTAFTPMTSVSSLKVNHPSATSVSLRDISNSQERIMSDAPMDESSQLQRSPQPGFETHPARRQSGGSFQRPSRIESNGDSSSSQHKTIATTVGHNIRPTARTSEGSFTDPHKNLSGPSGISSGTLLEQFRGPQSTIRQDPSTQNSRPQTSSSLPQTGKPQNSDCAPPAILQVSYNSGGVESQASASSTSKATPKQARVAQPPLTRNTVDPAYEFSDEEAAAQPSRTLPALTSSVPKQISKHRTKVLAKTPIGTVSVSSRSGAAKPLAKSPLDTAAAKTHQRVHSEGLDELSLGVEDFIMLSSQPRTNPLLVPQIGIKHEDAADSPTFQSVPAAKKRKLEIYQKDDFDELSVLGASSQGIPSTSQPTIKTEADEPSPRVARPIMPKRRGRPSKQKTMEAGESSSSQKTSSRAAELAMPIRTSTPLLDLTPVRNRRMNADRMKEIGDSEAEESTPESPTSRTQHHQRGQTMRPVDPGSMTPISKSRWNRDSLKAERVSVLVKTPGGTMRRCGVDGFNCRKSFCFRCSANGSASVA